MRLRGHAEVAESWAKNPSRTLTHKLNRFLVLRPSLGVKVDKGTWLFSQGDVLDGVLITHPVNAARKIVIRTDQGTFNVNAEDVKRL